MKQIELTLYEIFGYLVPGAVFAGGIGLLFWAIFFPQSSIEFDLKTPEVWISFLVAAYLAGHVVQALGNQLLRAFTQTEKLIAAKKTSFPAKLVEQCRHKIKEWTNADATDFPGQWVYRVCDEAVVRSGKVGDRDLFIYREGFYRGTSMGMIWMCLGMTAMIVRLWFFEADGKAIKIGSVELTLWRLVFLAAISLGAARLLWLRYWRFAEYRVTQALVSSLLLEIKSEKEKGTGQDGGSKLTP
jgi:hypothetical protein